jgi:hypothetical protein
MTLRSFVVPPAHVRFSSELSGVCHDPMTVAVRSSPYPASLSLHRRCGEIFAVVGIREKTNDQKLSISARSHPTGVPHGSPPNFGESSPIPRLAKAGTFFSASRMSCADAVDRSSQL